MNPGGTAYDTCKEGYKSCNEGTGEKALAYCVPEDADCPLSDISYTEAVYDTTDPKNPTLVSASEATMTTDSSVGTPLVNFVMS